MPLVNALEVTKTSNAANVLFFFLVSVTLGIYLLVVLCLANCIASDSCSFYRQALAAMEDFPRGQPEPEPNNEISQLEPGDVVDEVEEFKLCIPEENQLKTLCKQVFLPPTGSLHINPIGSITIDGESNYDLLTQMQLRFFIPVVCLDVISDGKIANDFNYSSAFTLAPYGDEGDPFRIDKDISVKTWEAFTAKLSQLKKWQQSAINADRFHISRDDYLYKNLSQNLQRTYPIPILAQTLAEKVVKVFQEELDYSTNERPLSDFFKADQFAYRRERISIYVRKRIISSLEDYKYKLKPPNAESPSDYLKPLQGKPVNDVAELSAELALEPSGREFDEANAETDNSDEKAAIDEFNRLLRGLDATVRKALASVSIEFGFAFDDDGQPQRTEKMPMGDYLAACAEEWWEMANENDRSKTNRAYYEEAKADLTAAQAAFTTPMTDDDVANFLSESH